MIILDTKSKSKLYNAQTYNLEIARLHVYLEKPSYRFKDSKKFE